MTLLVAFAAAGARPGPFGSVGPILIGITFVLPLALATAAALAVTLACRVLARQSLFSRATLRHLWLNLVSAVIWLVLAFGGDWVLKSSLSPAVAQLGWVSCACAISAALMATTLQALLARRFAVQPNDRGTFRVWAAISVCVAILFYQPFVFGATSVTVFYDYIRPAMRAVGVLPTPTLDVAGYRIDVPFQDRGTSISRRMPGDQPSEISVPLPAGYGLTAPGGGNVRVTVYRRDAPSLGYFDLQKERSKKLDAIQAGDPGRDAVFLTTERISALSMRLAELQGVDVMMAGFDAATSSDVAELALRRFLKEKVHKIR